MVRWKNHQFPSIPSDPLNPTDPKMNVKQELLVKKPFFKTAPYDKPEEIVQPVSTMKYRERPLCGVSLTQADFVEWFYPSSSKVMSQFWFPDRLNYGKVMTEEGEEIETMYRQSVFRVSCPLPPLITTQRISHLTGNDVRHELTDSTINQDTEELHRKMLQGWYSKGMETAIYKFIKSELITADVAIVFYMSNGKMGWKVLSYLEGDTLYPHYDPETGRQNGLTRKFTSYDESGKALITWVEYWDDTYMWRFKQTQYGINSVLNKAFDFLGLDNFTLVDKKPHGAPFCPAVYFRSPSNLPCYGNVIDLIDNYNVALSYLCQNNMAYAFPIMLLAGDDIDIKGDIYGQVKAVTMGKDDKVSYLEQNGSHENFKLQLSELLKQIFWGSFAVVPPEVKSGDLPGIAVKLIYSPSLEIAQTEAKELQQPINDIVTLFKHFYGTEIGKVSAFDRMETISFIEPYIHQSNTETIQNLVAATGSGILSKQTASDLTGYDRTNEWDKIIAERKQEEAADRLYQLKNGSQTS